MALGEEASVPRSLSFCLERSVRSANKILQLHTEGSREETPSNTALFMELPQVLCRVLLKGARAGAWLLIYMAVPCPVGYRPSPTEPPSSAQGCLTLRACSRQWGDQQRLGMGTPPRLHTSPLGAPQTPANSGAWRSQVSCREVASPGDSKDLRWRIAGRKLSKASPGLSDMGLTGA